VIERVLAGVGVEPFEQLGGGRFLELNRGDETQHLVPLDRDVLRLDIGVRENLVVLLLILATLVERVERALAEIFDPRGEGKAQEMQRPEQHFTIAPGIRGMNIAFDHIIVHQAINDIVGLMFGRANDERIRQEVAHINEGVGADSLVLAKVLKGIAGMEGIDGHFKLLAIAGGVEQAIGVTGDLRER